MSEADLSNGHAESEILPTRYYLTRECGICAKKTAHVFETVGDNVGKCTKCKGVKNVEPATEMHMGDETSKDGGKTRQHDKAAPIHPETEVPAPPPAPPPASPSSAVIPRERTGAAQLRHEKVFCYAMTLDALKHLAEAFSWADPEDFPLETLSELGTHAAHAFFKKR